MQTDHLSYCERKNALYNAELEPPHCVHESFWHIMPGRAAYWKKCCFIYMLKGTTSQLWAADKKKGNSAVILAKERGGGNGVKAHIKGSIYNMPLGWGETHKAFANKTGSPKSLQFLKRSVRK